MVANSNCFGEGLELDADGKLYLDLVGTGAVNYADGVIDVCVGTGLQIVSDSTGRVCIETIADEVCTTCVATDTATNSWVAPSALIQQGDTRCQGGVANAISVCNPATACGPMVVQLTKQNQAVVASTNSGGAGFFPYVKCRGGVGATIETLGNTIPNSGGQLVYPWVESAKFGMTIDNGPDEIVWTNPDIIDFVTLQPGECYARQVQVCVESAGPNPVLFRWAYNQQSAYGVSVPSC